jgi:molybdate transport system substrate-binding protein
VLKRFLIAASVALLLPSLDAGQAPPVRVLASNGVRAVLHDLVPECERVVGQRLAVEFGTSASIKRRIEANEAFDAAILASDVIDDLMKEGRLARGSRAEIGRSGVGVGIRRGAAKPDLRTPESMRHTLLSATNITYGEEGASRPVIDRMIRELGIADNLNTKTNLTKSVDESMDRVRRGTSDMVLTLISEIVPVEDAELVGPLPAPFQSYVTFAAGISVASRSAAATHALVRFLTGRSANSAFKAKGFEPDR